MPRGRRTAPRPEKPIEQYEHRGKKRANNPPVGLVTPETDPEEPKKTYSHDPHLDPQLVWSGKAERTSFEVPTVSLHVHERIDPRTILEAVRRPAGPSQPSLFEAPEENPPLREAIDFYKHAHGWSNRLIAGDSLLVMNSLLEKEGLAGHVQMIYIDPPYGVRYASNFQPFVNQRDVRDARDSDLTREPEMVRAFRDTWELGIHSYLSYLRDRLLLCRELLSESGSIFVQIGDTNLHLVRGLLDDVFGSRNFVTVIAFQKTSGLSSPVARVNALASVTDFLLWYARDSTKLKYRQLHRPKEMGGEGAGQYTWVREADGTERPLRGDEREGRAALPPGARLFAAGDLGSPGYSASLSVPFEHQGRVFKPGANAHWKTTVDGLRRLVELGRLKVIGDGLYYKRFIDDFPVFPLTNIWTDTGASFMDKVFVVQTVPKVVQRALLMTTDPADLVLDPTCGSGTTAYIAEHYGRRWITCDTSRVAVTLAKQRLMTAVYEYYQLAHPEEGVASGFRYKSVPHVTLGGLANNEPAKEEQLFDQPLVDRSKLRVAGPFTVEAVPAPVVRPVVELQPESEADESVARRGATLRHTEWRAYLLRSGIRGRGGQVISFSRVEPQGGTRYLHAIGETKEEKPRLVAISFGPEHAPLEQRQVEFAWEEAHGLRPRPQLLVFAAFQFDPEAAKDIDETDPARAGVTFLRVQMDSDLLVEDLKKRPRGDHSFWLIGQPDAQLRRVEDGKFRVEVAGFDYYDPRTGAIESGDTSKIAMWLLDPDYDRRSLFPRQVFFPLASAKDGWARLAKDLRSQLDEAKLEAYRGMVSLPFEAGKYGRAAVKIVDDRGIESMKILELE